MHIQTKMIENGPKIENFDNCPKVEILKTDICRLYVDGKSVQKRRFF